MITGVFSNDIDYLVYLAIKDGSYNPDGYVVETSKKEDKLGVPTFEELIQALKNNEKG